MPQIAFTVADDKWADVRAAFGATNPLTGESTLATKAQIEDELKGVIRARLQNWRREQREKQAAIADAAEVI